MASNIKTLSGMMNHAVLGLQTINTMSPRKNIQIIASTSQSQALSRNCARIGRSAASFFGIAAAWGVDRAEPGFDDPSDIAWQVRAVQGLHCFGSRSHSLREMRVIR